VHQLFIGFKKVYDSVRRKVLYNVFIELGTFIKLVRLIKMCLNETYNKVRIVLKQEYSLLPLLFNFALEYSIRKVKENKMGLKLHGTHLLLVYGDDVNLLGDNINAIKKNRNL
jgi:hypothetical protein